jgi:ATP-dependent Lon protease
MGKKRSGSINRDKKKKIKLDDNEVKDGIITDNEEDDTYVLGDDEEVNPDELDQKGNVKDLFNYEDEEDYQEYDDNMKKREEKIKKKAKKSDSNVKNNSSSGANFLFPILFPQLIGSGGEMKGNKELIKRIMSSELSDKNKAYVLSKLKNSDLDKPKQVEWIDSLLNIPFGKLAPVPIKTTDPQEKIKTFFQDAYDKFNKQVYGLQNVKDEIINYLAQFITAGNTTNIRVLALYGNAGIGKTHIVRNALANVLHRHLCCINMGGIRDAAHFYGFSYTYSGSKYGVIAQQLMDAKVMNPIICLEEVDKISDTKEGYEIQNILMHLTDPEQNYAFQDKYFSGIDIDMSKAVIVMTLNNPELLDPILLNRLHLVKVPDPTIEDKINILKNFIYPKICQNIGFDSNSLILDSEILTYIINKYNEKDKGMRTLRKHIETIILKLNTIKLIGCDLSGKLKIKFPLELSTDLVDKILDTDTSKEESNFQHMYM